jgi:hypothetical protein
VGDICLRETGFEDGDSVLLSENRVREAVLADIIILFLTC